MFEIKAMRPIFYNDDLQRHFETNGYVKIQLLDKEQVSRLLEIEEQYTLGLDGAFVPSICSPDKEFRKSVDRSLKEVLLPKLKNLLINYKPVFGNFLRKPPAENTDMGLHQDWNFVDENEFVALNVWCSLSDTDLTNGALQLIEGSHKLPLPIRGRNIDSPLKEISDYLFENSTVVNSKAGEVVIYDVRLLHGSNDNKSDSARVAAALVMAPEEANLIHYVKHPTSDSVIYKLEVDADFFTDISLIDYPSELIDENSPLTITNTILKKAEFDQLSQSLKTHI